LRRLFGVVVQRFDCTILVGHRERAEQEKAYAEGASKVRWPRSKHNKIPALAADVAPYPIDWSDRERFMMFGGYVLATADALGIPLRWGGDWKKDRRTTDNGFDDLVHFEITGD